MEEVKYIGVIKGNHTEIKVPMNNSFFDGLEFLKKRRDYFNSLEVFSEEHFKIIELKLNNPKQ